MNGLNAGIDREARNARRPAALSRDVRNFSRADGVIRLLHLLDGPGFQNRIADVRNPVSGLIAVAVGNIGMALLRNDRTRSPVQRRQIIVARRTVRDPSSLYVGPEIRD